MARIADPSWPKGYSIPQNFMPSIETAESWEPQICLGTGRASVGEQLYNSQWATIQSNCIVYDLPFLGFISQSLFVVFVWFVFFLFITTLIIIIIVIISIVIIIIILFHVINCCPKTWVLPFFFFFTFLSIAWRGRMVECKQASAWYFVANWS